MADHSLTLRITEVLIAHQLDTARCTCAKAPKLTAWSMGTPVLELTWAEMSRTCPTITARNR